MAASVVTDRANAVRQYDSAHLQRHNTRTRRACAVYPAGLRSLLRPSASPGGAGRETDACLDCWRGGVGTKRQLRPGRKAVTTQTEAPLSAAFAANRSTGYVAPALACSLPTEVAEKVEAGLRSVGLEDLSAEEASWPDPISRGGLARGANGQQEGMAVGGCRGVPAVEPHRSCSPRHPPFPPVSPPFSRPLSRAHGSGLLPPVLLGRAAIYRRLPHTDADPRPAPHAAARCIGAMGAAAGVWGCGAGRWHPQPPSARAAPDSVRSPAGQWAHRPACGRRRSGAVWGGDGGGVHGSGPAGPAGCGPKLGQLFRAEGEVVRTAGEGAPTAVAAARRAARADASRGPGWRC
eukprot:scaffold1678_cov110-Isochrysis_galbana.AAC.11